MNNYKENHSLSGEAYLIYLYKISDSRGIVVLFTKDFGKVKGFIRINKKNSSILRPFTRLWFHATKKKNTTNIDKIETIDSSNIIQISKFILVLFYLNELLNLYLEEYATRIKTFEIYSLIIKKWNNLKNLPAMIVKFELIFLDDIGCGITLPDDINVEADYYFHPNNGFFNKRDSTSMNVINTTSLLGIHGKILKEIKLFNFLNPKTVFITREIFRLQIEWHLGKLPNNSRRLLKLWNELKIK